MSLASKYRPSNKFVDKLLSNVHSKWLYVGCPTSLETVQVLYVGCPTNLKTVQVKPRRDFLLLSIDPDSLWH